MNRSERRRLFLLGLCLTATLAVAAVSGIEPAESVREGAPASVQAPAKGGGSIFSKVNREPIDSVEADIFAARTWQPASPPPPASTVAPAASRPAVPSLPFVYAGQLGDLQTGKVVVYLTRADAVYSASVGDVIDENYRIEAISDRQITIVYLPMKAQQTLAIPGN